MQAINDFIPSAETMKICRELTKLFELPFRKFFVCVCVILVLAASNIIKSGIKLHQSLQTLHTTTIETTTQISLRLCHVTVASISISVLILWMTDGAANKIEPTVDLPLLMLLLFRQACHCYWLPINATSIAGAVWLSTWTANGNSDGKSLLQFATLATILLAKVKLVSQCYSIVSVPE